jgi:tetratricopeptide (TPR) repeat protein
MSKDIDKNLFIDSSMQRFYQQLLGGIGSYQELGNRIIRQIKAACAFRQVERVRELSEILINFPIKEYQLTGHYYIVWCDGRESKYNTKLLERIIEQTTVYKTKAMFSLAAFEGYQGRTEASIYFYTEALKTCHSISDYIILIRSIAALKSVEGFHESALKDLENLLPIIRHAEPLVYYDFLNSYAVELGEAGRGYEARNISSLVLASPFAHAYPEWRETARELREPNRAFISVPQIEREPVEIETVEAHHASESKQPARMIAFPELKEAPQPQKPDRLTPQEIRELSLSEKRELILAAIRTTTMSEFEYDRLMVSVGLLKSGPADHILNLEDEETLDDLIVVWANHIEPDVLAGVLSALRDCEDRTRQRGIIDRMIRKAFEQSPLRSLTEEAWRLRVERRLPKK